MSRFSTVYLFFLAALFGMIAGCSDSSTTPTSDTKTDSSSSVEEKSSPDDLSSETSNGSQEEELLSSGTSSLEISSNDNGLPNCAPSCVRGEQYNEGEQCMRGAHNWTSLVEGNNQVPSDDFPNLWRNDGECNFIGL